MSHFVLRTCTEIGKDGAPIEPGRPSDGSVGWFGIPSGDDSSAGPGSPSRSLEHYRESDAYVLLGAPGAGKTESFRQEAGRGGGRYVTARDFIALGAGPEWRDATTRWERVMGLPARTARGRDESPSNGRLAHAR